jgi:hypothetical protein
MQTFLPYESFVESAQVLDRLRLGKQRVETFQIAKVVSGESSGWQNHPAVIMWKGHPEALLAYQAAICSEWMSRGYIDTCLEKTFEILGVDLVLQNELLEELTPVWLGHPELHISHQSNLLRKDEDWYRRFFPEVSPDIPYFWPVQILR